MHIQFIGPRQQGGGPHTWMSYSAPSRLAFRIVAPANEMNSMVSKEAHIWWCTHGTLIVLHAGYNET